MPDGTTDAIYLETLLQALDKILSGSTFDLAIYIAGADPFEDDRLGRLKLTKQGLGCRDTIVLSRLQKKQIPIAIAMGGGYAQSIDDIVDIHAT